MTGKLTGVVLSIGLAMSPAPKTEMGAIDIIKQGVQAQKEVQAQAAEQAQSEVQEQTEVTEISGQAVTETFVMKNEEGLSYVEGVSNVTGKQLATYFEQKGGVYPAEILAKGGAPDLETFCEFYIEEAKTENIRADVAFAQAMKETGFLRFGGDVSVEQFNFSGLGATGGGVPGNVFVDVQTGIRAQIQHLKAYATEAPLVGECVDLRYDYVQKATAPYVEWLGQKENPTGAGWAVAQNYGYDIVSMVEDIHGN